MTPFRAPPLPEVWSRPPKGRVLVVAPHPDDETMGLGGTLRHHANQGDVISALFVCNGIQGDPHGYYERAAIVPTRQAEAREAAQILGISEVTFLDYPDNLSDADIHVFEGLPENPDDARRALVHGFADQLATRLRQSPATIVYYPWDQELNGDHWVIGQSVRHLVEVCGIEFAHVDFLGYDVWSPCIPQTVVDTSDVIHSKLAAVLAYRSQNLYMDYRHAVLGLDAYRSLLLPRGATYGEGFVGVYRSAKV